MRYRVKTGRPLRRVQPDKLSAVQSAIREREDGMSVAMSFDPGTVDDSILNAHAMDILMGLLYVRGWRAERQDVLLAKAADWPDRWWQGTLGPGAFIVESALWPHPQCDVDDLNGIMGLAATAWCMELDICKQRRPTPDLMTAATAEGLSLSSIHNEPWNDAFRESFDSVMPRMRTQPPASGSRSHAYVETHLEGSSVEPWSLPERSCVFGTMVTDPQWKRVYVVLRDTAEVLNPQTARALLGMMLSSGADD